MTALPENRDVAALLDWYQAMGVDEIVSTEPTNWFEYKPPAAPKPAQTPSPVTPGPPRSGTANVRPAAAATPGGNRFSALKPDDAVMQAREKARKAASLEELRDVLAGFDGCPLKVTAKSLCFADGNPRAPAMFIGEAPGRDEDIQGRPFVGRAGKLLDRMLAAVGMNREEHAYITNMVYWRPPGNRTPTLQEAQVCRPFLDRQIELIEPEIIVLLGGVAAKQLLNTTQGIMRLRGRWKTFSPGGGKSDPAREYPTLATLHPAYLLRTPEAKRLAWRDFLKIREALSKKL